MYRCEKCNQNFQNFNYRIMMQAAVRKFILAREWFFFKVTDAVGQQYCTFFGETAEQILGKPADELGEMFNSDGNEFDDFINTKSCLVCLFFTILFKTVVRNSSSVDAQSARSTKTSSASKLQHSESHRSTTINTASISPAGFRSSRSRKLNSQVHLLKKFH